MSDQNGILLFERDENGEWKTPEPSIKLTLGLHYPDGQTIAEEIGELFALPPEPYDTFVVELATALRQAADAFEAAHEQAKAEEEQQ